MPMRTDSALPYTLGVPRCIRLASPFTSRRSDVRLNDTSTTVSRLLLMPSVVIPCNRMDKQSLRNSVQPRRQY